MITQDILKSILSYDQETGIFTWISSQGRKVRAGDRADYVDACGYVRIGFAEITYYGHRLAFLYMTGEFPKYHVDHINHVTDDNRWENLRSCTASENARNRGKQINNTSGYKGVTFSKSCGKWQAQIAHNGKRYCIGQFPTPEEASEAYLERARELHGDFHHE